MAINNDPNIPNNPFENFDIGDLFGGRRNKQKDGDVIYESGDEEPSRLRERLSQMSRRALVVLAVILVLVLAFCYWWFHPPINIHSIDLWYFLGIFVLAPSFIIFFSFRHIYARGMGKREKDEKKSNRFRILMFVPVVIALVGVIGWFASLSLFPGNAEKYATILTTEEMSYTDDIHEADFSQIPFIDGETAAILGNRTLGAIPEYVSQFEISPLYSQINYQDAPVRVSPLLYADLFKWFTNRGEGIPAYVIVNMTTQDTDVVRLENHIFYSESEPLVRNVDRHVQLSYPFYMFDQKSFEIDDDGNPYWIYPVQERTIGLFGGTTIQRVVLCNASTGECEDLPIEDVPQWVDRAYPSALLIQQYNWSGSLAGGWINSWLGQAGVKQTTPGTDGALGYNYLAKDDDVWVYSGVTSATADNSIIGFVLINQRTAESHFYPIAGATEESAMNSAQGQVQHLRYRATFPLLINVGGQPTYFMALKDDAGLVKMYAMIDIQRYQNVAVGDTLASTQKSYETLLRNNGISTSEGSVTSEGSTVTGTILSVQPVVIEGNSHYYLLLDGDDRIFDCPVATVVDVVRYDVGSKVTLTVSSGDGTLVTVDAIAAG